MDFRIAPDKNQPSVSIEIPLQKPIPDYDLEEVEQPTPRDVDGILVQQGFRDLVDDARGILTELVDNPPPLPTGSDLVNLELTELPHFEIAQLTGAICPGEDEVYRPGLWIVLRDKKAPKDQPLHELALEYLHVMLGELLKRLGL